MKTSSLVSVLIPTYNSAAYLEETINSVLSQSFTDYELIVVDNNSTDGTETLVKRYLADPRISYFKNNSNIGLVGNFNKCLQYAKGKYIKFLCSDDKFHPDLLSRFVNIMEQYPGVSLVTSNKEYFGLHTEQREIPYAHLQKGNKIIAASLQDYNWIGEPTSVMFRSEHLHIGHFNPSYTYLVDWDMWLRLLTLGDCYIIPDTLSFFRQHSNQTTALLKQNFTLRFEEYFFFKNIKNTNPYKIDLSKIDIDRILKKKAINCVRLAVKLLPRIRNKKSWETLNLSLKIAIAEKTLFSI